MEDSYWTFWGSRTRRAGRCLYEICQRQSLSTQAGREDPSCQGDEGTFLYAEHYRRHYVGVGGDAGSESYNATITEYLNSVLLYALMQKQESEWHLKLRPVKIAMPVNLRRFFPSRTLRNFITMIYPGIDPRLGEYTFEEIVTGA